jgi:hypothetical protein
VQKTDKVPAPRGTTQDAPPDVGARGTWPGPSRRAPERIKLKVNSVVIH